MSKEEALKILNLPDNYTYDKLRNNYRNIMKQVHPDRNLGNEIEANSKSQQVKEAYDILLKKFKNNQQNEQEQIIKLKTNLARDISNLKNKYHDYKELINLCNYYFEVFNKYETLLELEIQKEEFETKLKLLKLRYKILKEIKIFQDKLRLDEERLNNSFFKEFFNSYHNSLNNVLDLESLEELENSYKKDLENLKKELEVRKKNLNTLKDKTKRVCIYNFYLYAKDSSITNILKAKELLSDIINLLNLTTINDIANIANLVSSIDYKNIDENKSKIEFYLLSKKDNFNVKNLDIDKLASTLSSKEDNDSNSIEDINLEKDLVKDFILDNLYTSATNTDIKNVNLILDLFSKILIYINNMSKEELTLNSDILKKVDFRNLRIINEIIDYLKLSSKIYVSLKTGNLFTVEDYGDRILIKSLREEYQKVISRLDFELDYISIRNFFKWAISVSGYEVLQKDRKGYLHQTLFIDGRNYLYFYESLMLEYNDSTYGDVPRFNFRTVNSRDGWIKGNRKINYNQEIDALTDREYCEDLLMEQIKDEYFKKETKKRI